ncbi:MAG: hypothetical protein BJ554DRAFT_6458 [Olpidium bornovanus]|uniref:Uncharacterized protein n=1 Tax=Olpidium bornovanus TaxID=278681 RepID=A0A8H8DK70_9FUNG|nr:MAG: hypothetical protein BJ554DRAFT_6458 [Olpidium bornovanus]
MLLCKTSRNHWESDQKFDWKCQVWTCRIASPDLHYLLPFLLEKAAQFPSPVSVLSHFLDALTDIDETAGVANGLDGRRCPRINVSAVVRPTCSRHEPSFCSNLAPHRKQPGSAKQPGPAHSPPRGVAFFFCSATGEVVTLWLQRSSG